MTTLRRYAADALILAVRLLDPQHPVLAAYDARQASLARHPSQVPVIPQQLRQRTGTQPPQFGRRSPIVGQDEGQ